MAAVLEERDLAFLQNRLGEIDLAAPVFRIIINWGCKKNPSHTYKEYIQAKHGDKFKGFIKKDKLNETNCDGFDVTFLYELIPYVCDYIGHNKVTDPSKDPKLLESLLKKAKDTRNSGIHEYDTASSRGELPKVKNVLVDILTESARLYNQDQQVLDNAITEVRDGYLKICQKCHDRSSFIDYLKRLIKEEAIREIKDSWECNNGSVISPLSHQTFERKSVYSDPKMSVLDDGKVQRNFSIKDVIDDQKQFVLIEGKPGSGKSMVTKRLMDMSLENSNANDIVIHFSCRTVIQGTVVGLLREKIPNATSIINDKDLSEIITLLSIKVIIDGWDEANAKAQNLLKDLLEKSKNCNNWSFVISSRPLSCNEFRTELAGRGIASFRTVHLQPISTREEKKKFLAKYMLEKTIKDFEVCDLEKVSDKVMKQLTTPYLLFLLYDLLAAGVDISSCKNYGSLLSFWRSEIIKDMRIKIKDKLPDICNEECIARQVLELISKKSLELLCSSTYFITKECYDEIIDCLVESSIPHAPDIEFKTVLSCLLTPEGGSYHFCHATSQEYLAAYYVVLKLKLQESSYSKNQATSHRPASELCANLIIRVIMDVTNSNIEDDLER